MNKKSFGEKVAQKEKPTNVPWSKKSFTVPGMSISPAQAVKMFATGALQRKMDAVFGEETPNVQMMSHLERLELQAEYRERLLEAKEKLDKINEENDKIQKHNERLRMQEEIKQSLSKQTANEPGESK